jgi:hypothetical protein
MARPCSIAPVGAAVIMLALLAGGAAAQSRAPVTGAPLPLTPQTDDDRAKEKLNYERERHRLDLDKRRIENQRLEDSRDRSLLGAPTFLPPGTTVVVPYGAPQYQYGGQPSYQPGYQPPTYQTPTYQTPTAGVRPGCQQSAPAYDEAGRFLGNVCVR